MGNSIVKVHCNECRHETKHTLLKSHKIHGEEILEDSYPIRWHDTYELLECCGCESVVLRDSYFFEPTKEMIIKYYPPRVSRPSPRWKDKLPGDISTLLDEIYNALHADSRRLAIMGARTIVDTLCERRLVMIRAPLPRT